MRRLLALVFTALVATAALASTAGAESEGGITPVERLPFPERGFVVDLTSGADVTQGVTVTENGRRVSGVKVKRLSASGLRSGVVLAIDTSESMLGDPINAAVAAAREFVKQRRPGQLIGIVAFDGGVRVLERPTESNRALRAALADTPELSYGTRIHDGIDRSLEVLRGARLSTGSVIVLSDGTDTDSLKSLDTVVAAATQENVRVFTVGLRSPTYNGATLRSIADRTGGEYAEATTSAEVATIYRALGRRLAGEYLVQYKSNARPKSPVDVRISIDGATAYRGKYVAPTPEGVDPYHRSLLTRFLLSSMSILVLALLGGAGVAWGVAKFVRSPDTELVERISEFSSTPAAAPNAKAKAKRAEPDEWRERTQYTRGWWARLDRDLDVARVEMSTKRVVGWTLIATVLVVAVVAIVSPIVALLGFLTPLVARALIKRKLSRVQSLFAEQLPTNLQVLASALRAGHSFNGALDVVLDNAQEPARSELSRIVRDDKFGIPPDVAIRSVAERTANRDLEQVALLAELQRTAGGNAAEVLDTVVGTIRERSEIRGLVKTLTAQGRMARWILTALPLVLVAFQSLMNPDVTSILFNTGIGQVMLVISCLLVILGSLWIQRIVDVEV